MGKPSDARAVPGGRRRTRWATGSGRGLRFVPPAWGVGAPLGFRAVGGGPDLGEFLGRESVRNGEEALALEGDLVREVHEGF